VKSATNPWLQEKKMGINLTTLISAALLGLTGTAHANPVNVDVTLTVDNVYAIYSGNEMDIYNFHGSAANTTAGQISIPETYNFTINDGDVIYIAAWSDDKTAQGLLAEFNIDGTILTTANSQWEVMATGIDLDVGDAAPTMSELTTQINLANAGSVPSGGWVPTTLGDVNDTSWATSGSVHVPSMSSALRWAWYHKPGVPHDTFSYGFDHLEYLVFRLEFPIGGCCIDDACYNMTPESCELEGGLFSDVLCESTDWTCPEPEPETGACCIERPDGPECVETTKDVCKISEGIWFGFGTLCVDVYEECLVEEEPELGACCVKGECLETTEDECEAFVGDFMGAGSTCFDAAVTCKEDDGGSVSTDPGGAISDEDPSDGDTSGDGSAVSSSCSTTGAVGTQGLGLLLIGLLGLIRRRSAV